MMRGYFNTDGIEQFSRFGFRAFNTPFMWIGMALHIVFVIAVFILIIWIVKRLLNAPKHKVVEASKAIDILKERYAKGEITKEEFETIRKDLN